MVSFVVFVSVPVAAWLGVLTTARLMVAALLAGVASVLFSTAYQPFLPSLVPARDLPEANAKLQGSESAAGVVGPGLGGVVAQLFGAVTGLLGDALTFAVSALSLLRVRSPEPRQDRDQPRQALRREIAEGLRFIVRDPYLRVLTAYAAAGNYSESIMEAVLVVFLVRSVGLEPGVVGVLIAARGLGGVVGAMLSSSVARRFGTARGMLLCEVCTVPFVLLMPLTGPGSRLVFFLIAAVIPLAGIVASNIITASFRQTYVPTYLLGRTTATARLVSYGSIPLGALTGALLGQVFEPREVIIIAAIATTLSILVLLIGPLRRHRDFPNPAGAVVRDPSVTTMTDTPCA
ncbi:MFS transporter [Rugosimonospora africana]|uniref:MFS transporter n=1 Tax=Rugosimonospora africana TaxID=556532 RepID=A0A8J3QUV2_9ACTN|nr:MFS transporter [Rugosimonospora africana]